MGLERRRGRHRLGMPGHYHCMLIPAVADAVALHRSTPLRRLLHRLFERPAPRPAPRLTAPGPLRA